MTVHEQYDNKKAQYMRYTAEVAVYEEQLQKAISALKEKLNELYTRISVVEDIDLRNRVEQAIANINSSLTNLDNTETLAEATKELSAAASVLEQQIMRALND